MAKFDEMTREWLKEHIEMLYKRFDINYRMHQVAILAVHKDKRLNKQFLLKIEDFESRLPYLRKLNARGYNIYASVNVLQPDAKTRKAEEFLPYQTAIYLDFDSKQKPAHELWKELWQEIQAERLPEPSWVVKSSIGNYQVYWIFEEPVEYWKLEKIMKALNDRFGLDHTHDLARVFRIPGLRNKKEGKDDLVQPPKGDVIWIDKEKGYKVRITKQKYSREVFEKLYRIWVPEELDQPLKRVSRDSQKPSKSQKEIRIKPTVDPELEKLYRIFYKRRDQYRSLSETDAAFVTKALLSGYSPQRIANFLSFKRSDKPNPVYYACRTVEEVFKWLREKKKVKRVGRIN